MIIPEYGRNIQKMIDYCCQIEDRGKRLRTAEFIVNVMGQMNPKSKESGDYKQKLWDHLYIIANFRLDVDSPYPPPPQDVLYTKPQHIPYQQGPIRFRHYGRNIEAIIDKAINYPEGEEKTALIKTIANHLKKSYLNWNRNSVDDDLILQHLSTLSHHKLKLDEDFKLNNTSDILQRNKKKKFIKPGNGNGGPSNTFKPRKKQ